MATVVLYGGKENSLLPLAHMELPFFARKCTDHIRYYFVKSYEQMDADEKAVVDLIGSGLIGSAGITISHMKSLKQLGCEMVQVIDPQLIVKF